jgi:predicted Rossmann-fold nucleotide-binding protein
MVRKLIVAAIGGSKNKDAAQLAKEFGRKFVPERKWILLTGGALDPKNCEQTVKDGALCGCGTVNGLMVSILPKPKNAQTPPVRCDKVAETRQIKLLTGLGSIQRDPIVGTTADIVVAFAGSEDTEGTLVELAYAALQNRPIVFLKSRDQLRAKLGPRAETLRPELKKANEAYSAFITTTEDDLINAVSECLASKDIFEAPSADAAIREVERLCEPIKLYGDTHFRGLPDHPKIKRCFEHSIVALSSLGETEVFGKDSCSQRASHEA